MDRIASVNKEEGSSHQAGKGVEVINMDNRLDLVLSIMRVLVLELREMK